MCDEKCTYVLARNVYFCPLREVYLRDRRKKVYQGCECIQARVQKPFENGCADCTCHHACAQVRDYHFLGILVSFVRSIKNVRSNVSSPPRFPYSNLLQHSIDILYSIELYEVYDSERITSDTSLSDRAADFVSIFRHCYKDERARMRGKGRGNVCSVLVRILCVF